MSLGAAASFLASYGATAPTNGTRNDTRWRWPFANMSREFSRTERFCANHLCGFSCCANCVYRKKPVRLYYAHIQHTGGSTLECAAADLANDGLFIPLGHIVGHNRPAIMSVCHSRCGKAPFALSVRDPYAYHETLYRWTLVNSGLVPIRTWHNMTAADVHASSREKQIPLRSFAHWIRYVTTNQTQFLQSSRIAAACGRPCVYDMVIHTENLTTDFHSALRGASLIGAEQTLPMPHRNAVAGSARRPIAWTVELLALVTAAETSLFDEFGYSPRRVPEDVPKHTHTRISGRPCVSPDHPDDPTACLTLEGGRQ